MNHIENKNLDTNEEQENLRYGFKNSYNVLSRLTPSQRNKVVKSISAELDLAEEMTEEYLEANLK